MTGCLAGGEGLLGPSMGLTPRLARGYATIRSRRIVRTRRGFSPSSLQTQKTRLMAGCLAGGEGFEPPLAVSETAVLPLDDPPRDRQVPRLSFAVLRTLTCFTQTDFLTFNLTIITCYEASLA